MLSFIGQWRRVSLIKTLIVSLSSVILITSSSAVSVQDSGDSPITQKETKTSSDQKRRNAFLADPTIFYDQGRYYLYGTGNLRAFTGNPQEGFITYYSEDLKEWFGPAGAEEGFVFCRGNGFGKGLFWAPQVFRWKDHYWFAYAADEYIALARADDPRGPFTMDPPQKLPSATRQIDPFFFFDEGKIYFYYVKLDKGNRIFVAEMKDDLSGIKPETEHFCIHAGDEGSLWENTNNADWSVAEGPTVIRRGDKYYLFYSCNDFRSKDYAVGYAVSDSPLGPWKRYEGNPIISRHNVGHHGSGHGDIFTTPEGKMYYVLHTHFSKEKVQIRRTALVEMRAEEKEGEETVFSILPETFRFIEVPAEKTAPAENLGK